MMNLKSYEKVVMSVNELDDGSAVIDFDVTDECNVTTRTGGYVMTRQDNNDQCFYVVVCNANGDVLSMTPVPFDFIGEPEEEV